MEYKKKILKNKQAQDQKLRAMTRSKKMKALKKKAKGSPDEGNLDYVLNIEKTKNNFEKNVGKRPTLERNEACCRIIEFSPEDYLKVITALAKLNHD
jgi:hypothetical protein